MLRVVNAVHRLRTPHATSGPAKIGVSSTLSSTGLATFTKSCMLGTASSCSSIVTRRQPVTSLASRGDRHLADRACRYSVMAGLSSARDTPSRHSVDTEARTLACRSNPSCWPRSRAWPLAGAGSANRCVQTRVTRSTDSSARWAELSARVDSRTCCSRQRAHLGPALPVLSCDRYICGLPGRSQSQASAAPAACEQRALCCTRARESYQSDHAQAHLQQLGRN